METPTSNTRTVQEFRMDRIQSSGGFLLYIREELSFKLLKTQNKH